MGFQLRDLLKNYPGGSSIFDEKAGVPGRGPLAGGIQIPGAEEVDPNGDPNGEDGDDMSPMPIETSSMPRQILRSPLGSWMDRERKL